MNCTEVRAIVDKLKDYQPTATEFVQIIQHIDVKRGGCKLCRAYIQATLSSAKVWAVQYIDPILDRLYQILYPRRAES